MEFIDKKLLDYCEKFTSPESELLKELNRQTHLKVGQPRMLSGHIQGRFLSLLSKLTQPTNILEIGTYTGYSALCLAEGLKASGKLYSIDPNEETNRFAQSYIDRSAYKDQIQLVQGDAKALIPKMDHRWDLVFIDADKMNYGIYYDLVIDKVNSGGLIIADNVLWSGKVINETMDKDTLAIHNFNKKVSEDQRTEKILLPLRDGLFVLRRR